MSLIRIEKDGVILDFVKESLTIRKENNAMIRNFKVSHSNFPFLIVENKKAKTALGPRDITSVNKVKIINVDVYENDLKYYGQLEVVSYLKNYRKCNLKYASPLLGIMNKKISEFMPVVSVVTGEEIPTSDFVEAAAAIFTGDDSWPAYAEAIITQGYPAVKWNFPMMQWKDKFGTDLTTDDEWFFFKNFVNAFTEDGNYLLNTATPDGDFNYDITNVNVPMPQIYLLSPLFYALKSIGFTYGGDFPESAFIKKIVLLSTKNNLCKVYPLLAEVPITLGALVPYINPVYNLAYYELTADTVGTYIVHFVFTEPQYGTPAGTVKSFTVSFDGAADGYLHQRGKNAQTYDAFVEISVSESQLGLPIRFNYLTPASSMPTYSITVQLKTQNALYQMHPTIETGRYLPDWTLPTYINNLKNWFNLDVDIDDLRNKFILNFNEDWITNQLPEVIKKSMAITSYEQTPYQAFLLKHDNDEDAALWIERSGAVTYTNQSSDYAEILQGKFKFVPTAFGTSNLSDTLEEKNGIGLMIYDETNSPYTSETYDGKTLKIDGVGGIYDVCWKKFLNFRINASVIELTGGFTKTEIGKFIKTKRIHVDHQDYVVSVLDFKELKQDNYMVTFKVESVTF